MIQVMQNNISTYNHYSKERLSINIRYIPEPVIDIYVGEHEESHGLRIVDAHYIIIGMLIEQMRRIDRIVDNNDLS